MTNYTKLTHEFDTQMAVLASLRRERERIRSKEIKQERVVSKIRAKIDRELAKRDKG